MSAPMKFGALYLSPVIAGFAAKHPELNLRIDYDDRARDLLRDRFDIVTRIAHLRDTALMQPKLCEG
ncbi:MAG: LysR substrate-binding domain-containing protein [Paracoccaceae bacterium]